MVDISSTPRTPPQPAPNSVPGSAPTTASPRLAPIPQNNSPVLSRFGNLISDFPSKYAVSENLRNAVNRIFPEGWQQSVPGPAGSSTKSVLDSLFPESTETKYPQSQSADRNTIRTFYNGSSIFRQLLQQHESPSLAPARNQPVTTRSSAPSENRVPTIRFTYTEQPRPAPTPPVSYESSSNSYSVSLPPVKDKEDRRQPVEQDAATPKLSREVGVITGAVEAVLTQLFGDEFLPNLMRRLVKHLVNLIFAEMNKPMPYESEFQGSADQGMCMLPNRVEKDAKEENTDDKDPNTSSDQVLKSHNKEGDDKEKEVVPYDPEKVIFEPNGEKETEIISKYFDEIYNSDPDFRRLILTQTQHKNITISVSDLSEYDKNGKIRFGDAELGGDNIRLDKRLFDKQPDFIKHVLAHELLHLEDKIQHEEEESQTPEFETETKLLTNGQDDDRALLKPQ
ncbi:hypothetical protein TRICHSKD4_0708 [Roseibium sp. TrichSKD4]|uniref:hypothetical protein n=1 Tax=Roseibium sp. TrichSKD4 TaxID=744980 RepID=UPI0001E56674|nr:hypothetical protein [Roseibium sp. TrichSKD4]EFO33600.1 hypothetical protein TRICHSKD4_0708 [Roseibium sp. TrichSKD4]